MAAVKKPANVPLVVYQNHRDPTHTTVLRNQFAREMRKTFVELRRLIRYTIVDEDCFGLTSLAVFLDTPGWRAFNFSRTQKKVDGFMDWLQEQEGKRILKTVPRAQIGRAVETAWTNTYIESAYQKGMVRARQELRRAGYMTRTGERVPLLESRDALRLAFNQPMHADAVGILYSRTYRGLKGITDAMDRQVSEVLARTMAEGRGPAEVAKMLTRTIKGPVGGLGITDTLGRFIPAERRAMMLARTEIVSAHHQATIQEYRNWGAEGVVVKAEWQTAGFNVCDECAALEGRIFSLDEIGSMIPRHTLCRCCALPAPLKEPEKKEAVGRIIRPPRLKMKKPELVKKAKAKVAKPVRKAPSPAVQEKMSKALQDDTFNYKRLKVKGSQELEYMRWRVLTTADDMGVNLAKSQGMCDQVSVALWDNLGRPPGLRPHSVWFVEEEHVLLYAKKSGAVIDPTGLQFDWPGARVFTFKSKTPYKKWVKLADREIVEARQLAKKTMVKAAAKKKELVKKVARMAKPKAPVRKVVRRKIKGAARTLEDMEGRLGLPIARAKGVSTGQTLKVLNAVDVERARLFSQHPALRKLKIEKILVNKTGTSLGSWDRKTRVMRLHVETSMRPKGAVKVGSRRILVGQDSAATYRHEMGHIAADDLIPRKKWSKAADQWFETDAAWIRKHVSEYATVDMEECFAEMFSMLSKNPNASFSKLPLMEANVRKVLYGTGKKVARGTRRVAKVRAVKKPAKAKVKAKTKAAKVKAKKPVRVVKKGDVVKDRFVDASHRTQYVKATKEYKKFFKGLDDAGLKQFTKGEWDSSVQTVHSALHKRMVRDAPTLGPRGATQTWLRGGSNANTPLELKYMATQLEKGIGEMAWPGFANDTRVQHILKDLRKGSPKFKKLAKEYVNLRAFNQAYMERIGIAKKVTLYRGTGGKAGQKMARAVRAEGMKRTKWTIQDAPLAGYSSDPAVAHRFGAKGKGITVERRIARADIVMHKDLLSGVQRAYTKEQEFIVLGGKRKVGLKNIVTKKRRAMLKPAEMMKKSVKDKIKKTTKAQKKRATKKALSYQERFSPFSHYNGDEIRAAIGEKDGTRIAVDYVFKDKKPVGKIKTALDKAVRVSQPSKYDFVSYRGMVMNEGFTKKIQERLVKGAVKGKATSIKLPNPSSWSNSKSVAWDFAKEKGWRHPGGAGGKAIRKAGGAGTKESILLEVLVPEGTKAAWIDIAFGVGQEHVFSSGTVIDIVEVVRHREGWKLIGKMRLA